MSNRGNIYCPHCDDDTIEEGVCYSCGYVPPAELAPYRGTLDELLASNGQDYEQELLELIDRNQEMANGPPTINDNLEAK